MKILNVYYNMYLYSYISYYLNCNLWLLQVFDKGMQIGGITVGRSVLMYYFYLTFNVWN